MNKNNKKEKAEFGALMAILATENGATLDNKGIALKIKYEALMEYGIADIKRAVTWLVKNRTQTFPAMPTVREIIDAIDQVSGKLLPGSVANSECDFVLNFLKNCGAATSLPESHPVTDYLMTKVWPWFGWASQVKECDLVWFRRDFVSRFEQMEKDGLRKDMGQIGHDSFKSIGLDIKRIS